MAAVNVINDNVIGTYERFTLVGFKTVIEDRRDGSKIKSFAVLKAPKEPDLETLKQELKDRYSEIGYELIEYEHEKTVDAALDALLLYGAAEKEEKRGEQ